jgi:hypothetical protein
MLESKSFEFSAQYATRVDDAKYLPPGEVRNERKHKATCLKNKKKRKKRK